MKFKRFISFILSITLLFTVAGCSENIETANENNTSHLRLQRDDWCDDVKTAINDLLDNYGIDSVYYQEDSYAVFDFDNTSTIFDIEEQLCIYQLQVMAFEIKPKEMKDILQTDLSDNNRDLSEYGLIKGSYQDIIDDIVTSYTILFNKYGPFSAEGLNEEKSAEVQKDDYWKEFATKMRLLYELVDDVESSTVAYPWVLYWFYGMTEDQVYNLATASHEKYIQEETSQVTWTSPDTIDSKIGSVSFTWNCGFSVTENIKELWKVLQDNGIDVWVCSASCTGAVKAAIDVCGLHDYCKGMLAMTTAKDSDGKYINSYDYDTGCGYYSVDDGGWYQMTVPTKAQTFGEGKVTAITNSIAPDYNNHGPIAGFMDSTGDFNFCTEFNTLKLVCCFNRANRKITDGGGLIAEIAMYQKDVLMYNLSKANNAGDTLYVLQGRDENGMRTFRNSCKTLRYGEDKEKMFANEDNDTELNYIIDNAMPISEALNTFAIYTSADNSPIKIKFGFTDEYAGYHTHN